MTKLEKYIKGENTVVGDKVFVLNPQERLENKHIDGRDIYVGRVSSIRTFDNPKMEGTFFGDAEIVKYRDWDRGCWLTRHLPLSLKLPEYRILSGNSMLVHSTRRGEIYRDIFGYEKSLRSEAITRGIQLPSQIIRTLFDPIEQEILKLVKEYEDIRFQEDPQYRARMEEKRYLEQRRKLCYSTARSVEDGLRTAADYCFHAAARPGVNLEDELGVLADYLMKGCGSEGGEKNQELENDQNRR